MKNILSNTDKSLLKNTLTILIFMLFSIITSLILTLTIFAIFTFILELPFLYFKSGILSLFIIFLIFTLISLSCSGSVNDEL